VTKDNPRQGMAELLAQQRAGSPLTPAEAARQRRSGRRGSAPASAGPGPLEDRPLAGSQPSQDLPPAEEARAQETQASPEQLGAAGEAAATTADVKARTKLSPGGMIWRACGRLAGWARSCWNAADPAHQVKDYAASTARSVTQRIPRPVRRAGWRAASSRGALLAAASAVAVPLAAWLMARRRRQAVARGAGPTVRTQLRDVRRTRAGGRDGRR
jgi:hypothetical protein